MRWPLLCAARAAEQSLPPERCAPLAAFCGAAERPFHDFNHLREHVHAQAGVLPKVVVSQLSDEVDGKQAALFSRRFVDVRRLLAGMSSTEAQLLEIGLVMRTAEILAGPGPRALRVRAVVDFFYSQAALLHHHHPDAPTLQSLVDDARWTVTAPGIAHARLAGLTRQGPVHINVLRVRGRLRTIDCRGQGSLPQVVARHGADAGISGGFFLYSEPDIVPPSRRTDPVGLLVHGGSVLSPPVWRRSALLQTPDGRTDIAVLGLQGCSLRWPGGEQATIDAVNDPEHPGVVAFTRSAFVTSPSRSGVAIAVVGDAVIAQGAGAMPVPLAGAVISLPEVPRGERFQWVLPRPVSEGIAGGPRLLRAGDIEVDLLLEDFAGSAPPITFSKDETFDQNLLPRMAAGITADGDLLCVAVDGRNFLQAPGMTLRQTAALCRMLGCVEAMNLDGGSSKRMAVGGCLVDLPSTEVVSGARDAGRIRPVNTAVLFFGQA